LQEEAEYDLNWFRGNFEDCLNGAEKGVFESTLTVFNDATV
jgi:hypothetical protein